MGQDYHQLSAHELVTGLHNQSWSSEMLTQHFLERIAEANPKLHALHTLNPHALEQARAMDTRRAAGEKLPALAGLPISLKDAFGSQDLRTTYGLAPLAFHRARRDSQLVASLKRAGIIFLGRSAVPTASFDWNCRNQLFAECVNPHDPERVPGGSSGGAASALAAGLTPLELGSDVAGSIRYPAHCCGVYGLRTSDGWLPFGDIGPDPQHGFRNLAVAGPMAAHLSDLSLILDWFAAEFPDSRLQSPNPLTAQLKSPLKLAYSDELLGLTPDNESHDLIKNWLNDLKDKGQVMLTKARPDLDYAALHQDWAMIVGYEQNQLLPAAMPGPFKRRFIDQLLLKRLGPGWMRPAMLKGMAVTRQEYLSAIARCRSAQNKTDRFFQEFDAWVLPVSPSAALKRSECGTLLQTHLGPMAYTDYLSGYLCPTAMLGTPALALPVGKTHTGLPIGVQIHGPRFSDRLLLARFEQILANS